MKDEKEKAVVRDILCSGADYDAFGGCALPSAGIAPAVRF